MLSFKVQSQLYRYKPFTGANKSNWLKNRAGHKGAGGGTIKRFGCIERVFAIRNQVLAMELCHQRSISKTQSVRSDRSDRVLANELWRQTLTPTSVKSLGGFPGVCGMCVYHKVTRHLPCSLLNKNYHILLVRSAGQLFFPHISQHFVRSSLCHSVTSAACLVKMVTARQMVGYVAATPSPRKPGKDCAGRQ